MPSGTFGALNGNLYADEVNFEAEWLPDARRYLTNIVGKYGPQVQAVLKKAAGLDIKRICPLHGPVWRENLGWFIGKYDTWSKYEPEEQAVLIAYGTIYGNTQNAAEVLAGKLADLGVKNIAMYDVSVTILPMFWRKPSAAVIWCLRLRPTMAVYLLPWKPCFLS